MYVNSNRVNHFKEWLDYLFEDHGEIDKLLINISFIQVRIDPKLMKKQRLYSEHYCQIPAN